LVGAVGIEISSVMQLRIVLQGLLRTMNVVQRIKEALWLMAVIFVAFGVILAITYVVGLTADKAFGNHLLLRIFVAVAILTVLGWLLFRKSGRVRRP
jgi:hypothetical protein